METRWRQEKMMQGEKSFVGLTMKGPCLSQDVEMIYIETPGNSMFCI